MCTVTALVLTAAVFPFPAFALEPPLEGADERYIRRLIYGGEYGTAMPRGGKYAFIEILAVPDRVEKLYARHPRAVLALLLRIMDGAGPKDSAGAAAFASSLRKGNPAIGAAVLRLFKESKYDELDEDWGMTQRQHWIRKVKEN